MATHDYSIANATGAAFRADLNNALLAIASSNSSSAEPPVPYGGMIWTDLSGGGDGVVRRRNAANTAWLSDIGQDSIARAAAAAAQATADAALPRAGGTMTGAIVLPATAPTGTQAVNKAWADTAYQSLLLSPIAGSLLVGTAAGWAAKIDPGPANSILGVTGGLPSWQLTATTAASNAVVRAGADGTIDASFIPAVASGLKYRGTFKPVVNDEYPAAGDNGSGAGGAPAVGDFWVIDGLTTGGYTYLTGSLAGITVYNGDSIAYDGANWYRMGSSVALQGYMKTDGSTAMAGDLNLGTHNIVNVANITARTGTPPIVSGFQFDATNIFLSPQRGTTGPDLPAMPTGQIGTDLGRMQIFVGASGTNVPLIPLTFFSSTANYPTSSYVYNAADGYAYRAAQAITAGAFNVANWRRLVDTSGAVFVGNVSAPNFNVPNTGQVNFQNASGITRARLYMDGSGNLNIGGFDATGANHYNFMAFDYGTLRGLITNLYVDNTLWVMNSVQLKISDTSYTIVFNNASSQGRFYLTGNDLNLGFNTLTDAGAYWDTPLQIKRGADSGAWIRGSCRVWGFQGNSDVGAIIFGSGNANVYFSTAQFIFTHTCVAPAFSPSCDRRVKENIREASPDAFAGVTFKTFHRTDNNRDARGVIAQDFARWPEYLTTATLPDGEERLGLDVAGIALELAFNLRDRVAALESAATPPAPVEV